MFMQKLTAHATATNDMTILSTSNFAKGGQCVSHKHSNSMPIGVVDAATLSEWDRMLLLKNCVVKLSQLASPLSTRVH